MQQSDTTAHDPAPVHELSAEECETRRREQMRRNQAALEWLEELDHGDPEEQRETWELIERMIRDDPVRS